MKRDDDDGLKKRIGEVIESTRKENETAKEDRVIQTFKAEHEKLGEEKDANGHEGARESFE